MHAITDNNPLMQPIAINGLEYLTAQRLHADYIRNATERGEKIKHKRLGNFVRVINDIPNYNRLKDEKDVIYLTWRDVKAHYSLLNQFLSLAFALVHYRPLTLLTATAQMELTHHLDDELNKELAYRHSKAGAQPQTPLQGVIRATKAEFKPKFQGLIASHLNELNARTKQGTLKLPDDVGSPRVAGIVPSRISEGYKAVLGEDTYAQAKETRAQQKAQATHQVIEDLPLDMLRGMMYAFAISATSEQHYDDLMHIATGQKQLAMPFRWPVPQEEAS